MKTIKRDKKKISQSIQTGFECTNCNFENVVKGVIIGRPVCLNCGEDKLEQKWKNKLTTVTTVESV